MLPISHLLCFFFFFFNDTATTEIYTLSLHDALPISIVDDPVGLAEKVSPLTERQIVQGTVVRVDNEGVLVDVGDRKSTRLNSSHSQISYAVFCLKKKKKEI